MKIFAFGSSIVSSYWNGAATYYRGCYKYLARLGHQITFAEPNAYGRQEHRDDDDFSYIKSLIYQPGTDLKRMLNLAADADVVVKHSGIGVDDELLERAVLGLQGRSAIVFWDVDAPATIARMRGNTDDTFRSDMPQYDAVLTYGGGPWCRDQYLAMGARAYYSIYNGLDPETHYPVEPDGSLACDVVFLGNRLPDREARVEELFLTAAELAPKARFILGGEGWGGKQLPDNVRWLGHVPTAKHNLVNCSAGMVMNINRLSMAQSGFSPPTRVFEVAGSGSCLLCDDWPGVDDCFKPSEELIIIRNAQDVANAVESLGSEQRNHIGSALRRRALRDHTYAQRAAAADTVFRACLEKRAMVATP